MTILPSWLAVAILAVVWLSFRVPLMHRWRSQQARFMCQARWGLERSQPPAPIYAALRKMNALAIKPLLTERFGRRNRRVKRDRRDTSDGGIDGQMLFMGRVWLIPARRYGAAIRPEHVREVAALGATPGSPGPFNHAGHTRGTGHKIVPRHGRVEIISGQRLPASITAGTLVIGGRFL